MFKYKHLRITDTDKGDGRQLRARTQLSHRTLGLGVFLKQWASVAKV